MKKFKSLLAGLVLVFGYSSFGYAKSNEECYRCAIKIVSDIQGILIENRFCKITSISNQGHKQNDCNNKELVLWDTSSDSILISTYAITNTKITNKIIEVIKKEYIAQGKDINITYQAFKEPHKQALDRGIVYQLFFEKPILKIKFKRKSK